MTVLAPTGVIGPAEAAELKDTLLRLCSVERPLIHVDLRQVEELHLSGANSILRAAVEANRRRGTLTVATAAAGSVRSTLARSGLHHRLES
jgi:anti-anti-sigma regulatory factor